MDIPQYTCQESDIITTESVPVSPVSPDSSKCVFDPDTYNFSGSIMISDSYTPNNDNSYNTQPININYYTSYTNKKVSDIINSNTNENGSLIIQCSDKYTTNGSIIGSCDYTTGSDSYNFSGSITCTYKPTDDEINSRNFVFNTTEDKVKQLQTLFEDLMSDLTPKKLSDLKDKLNTINSTNPAIDKIQTQINKLDANDSDINQKIVDLKDQLSKLQPQLGATQPGNVTGSNIYKCSHYPEYKCVIVDTGTGEYDTVVQCNSSCSGPPGFPDPIKYDSDIAFSIDSFDYWSDWFNNNWTYLLLILGIIFGLVVVRLFFKKKKNSTTLQEQTPQPTPVE